MHAAVGKRKDEIRSCEKCRHLERGTHAPDDGIPLREEVEMVRIIVPGSSNNVVYRADNRNDEHDDTMH